MPLRPIEGSTNEPCEKPAEQVDDPRAGNGVDWQTRRKLGGMEPDATDELHCPLRHPWMKDGEQDRFNWRLHLRAKPRGEPNLRSVTNGKSVGNGQCGALVGLQSDFLSEHDVARH